MLKRERGENERERERETEREREGRFSLITCHFILVEKEERRDTGTGCSLNILLFPDNIDIFHNSDLSVTSSGTA